MFNGEFTPGNQFSAPTNPYYIQKFPIPPRNVEKAKALIKEAGVTTPITLDLMVPNQPDVKQVAEVLQAMSAEAGFDLKIRLTEFATSLDEGGEGQFPDLSDRLERPRSIPTRTSSIISAATRRSTGASIATRRRRPRSTRRACSPSRRSARPLMKRRSPQIEADKPLIYLYHQALIFAHSAKLQGYKQPPDGIIRIQDLKLAP